MKQEISAMASVSQPLRANSFCAAFCFWLGSIVFAIHGAAESAITSSPTSYEHGLFGFVMGVTTVSFLLGFAAFGFLVAVLVSPKTSKRDSRRLCGLSGALGLLYAAILSGYWVISRVFSGFSLGLDSATLFWTFCPGFPIFGGLTALWVARRVGFLGRVDARPESRRTQICPSSRGKPGGGVSHASNEGMNGTAWATFLICHQ